MFHGRQICIVCLIFFLIVCSGCSGSDEEPESTTIPKLPDICNPDATGDSTSADLISVWLRLVDTGCVVSDQVRATSQTEADECAEDGSDQIDVNDDNYDVVNEADVCEFAFIVEEQDSLSADPGDPPIISCDKYYGVVNAMNSTDALLCFESPNDYQNSPGITYIVHDVSSQVRRPSSTGCGFGTIDSNALYNLLTTNCPP